MDILYLVDRLENLIAGSRHMPLVNQIILKESDILNIVDQLRTTIPEEIKQARRVIQEKERILAQAQAEANALLTRAREESELTVNREGLLRAAEIRSQDMLRHAEQEAEVLKNEADGYVVETLRALREHLTSIETEIGRSVLSIEKGLASLEENAEQTALSDTAADEMDTPQPPSAQTFPRRASLAVDTMGGPMYIPEEDTWIAEDGTETGSRQDSSSWPGYDYRA